MSRRLVAAALPLLLLVVPVGLKAQDDASAGLFTEARHLPLVAQSIALRVAGGEAEIDLVQVFHNDGASVGQADYRLHLPQGAVVTSYGFWSNGRFLAAELREKQEAEQRHRAAAREGRASAILHASGPVHAISVHPVPAGQQVRVETSLRWPVTRELARSHVLLPVDSFLGQAAASTTILARITAEEPIDDFGAEGAKLRVLESSERELLVACATRAPVDLWWSETGPPLVTRAEAVPLRDGGLAFELRIVLDDAGPWKPPHERLHVVVDGSTSMRRRAPALRRLLDRLLESSPVPVQVHLVAEETIDLPTGAGADEAARRLVEGAAGHVARWSDLAAALEALDCGSKGLRCALVSDAPAVADASGPVGASLLLLADAEELAHFAGRLPEGASTVQPGLEPEARLLALADELARPAITVKALAQDGLVPELPGRQHRRVAEGGLLRLFGRLAGWGTLELDAELDGSPLHRAIELTILDAESEDGRRVSRGYHRELLSELMERYRAEASPELSERIVELSLREGIPTALTSLQVDDPRLSLTSIKPGDPLLRVLAEPGLVEVLAWYPFGEMRRLQRDAATGDYLDRFLVPRYWPERGYRVDLFKRYADGRIAPARVGYRLDDSAPRAAIRFESETGRLVVDTGTETPEVSSVLVHRAGAPPLSLSPLGSEWRAELGASAGPAWVAVRDRAGNRRVHPLNVAEPESDGVASAPAAPGRRELRLSGESASLRIEGQRFSVASGPSFTAEPALLRSLEVTALGSRSDADGTTVEWLVGTADGDLVRVLRSGDAWRGLPVAGTRPGHRITGAVPLPRGRWLVGVLGRGLLELGEKGLVGSPLATGTRQVSALVELDGTIYVGTADRGLFRIVGERVLRTRFPHAHVAALALREGRLEVDSGFGRFMRRGRDRFERRGELSAPEGSPRLLCSAVHEGRVWIGSFDRGLWSLESSGRLERAELPLSPEEAQVDALASHDGALYLGTQGGLLRLGAPGASGGEARIERLLDAPIHDLASGPSGLAIASSRGLFVVEGKAPPRRVDAQGDPSTGSFFAAAWFEGALFAGGMEGLYRFGPDGGRQLGPAEGFTAGWVSDLLADGERLLVGTYSEGLFALAGGRVDPVPGLEAQWIPPGGLSRAGADIWVGALGQAPARLRGEEIELVPVPARDVHGACAASGGALLLTSEGLLRVEEGASAGRTLAPPETADAAVSAEFGPLGAG